MLRKTQNRYNLTKDPFGKAVSVDELMELPGVLEARTRLKAALEGRSCAVLTGDAGVGKTFVLRALEAELPAGRYRLTYIHNATVNQRDFYRQLSEALGLEPKASASALFRMVHAHIEELASAQRLHPVLMLDEAHLLSLHVLAHLHILLNFQRDSAPFLSLVLVGLPELRDKLARNVLASLSARLPVRVHLGGLDAQQVGEYLRHRMHSAGCEQEVFSEEAVLLIAQATGGSMRKINNLASSALEVAAGARSQLIDAGVIQEAVKLCAESLV